VAAPARINRVRTRRHASLPSVKAILNVEPRSAVRSNSSVSVPTGVSAHPRSDIVLIAAERTLSVGTWIVNSGGLAGTCSPVGGVWQPARTATANIFSKLITSISSNCSCDADHGAPFEQVRHGANGAASRSPAGTADTAQTASSSGLLFVTQKGWR
jgi:hypothetical protein